MKEQGKDHGEIGNKGTIRLKGMKKEIILFIPPDGSCACCDIT
jgi:hypothetical protein